MKKVLLINVLMIAVFAVSVISASAEYWGYKGNNRSNNRGRSSVLNKHTAANRLSSNEQYFVARRVVEADVIKQEASAKIANADVTSKRLDNLDRAVRTGVRLYRGTRSRRW